MRSSSTRRKAAFVPWLAALVLGATAHAGWLIHELRDEDHPVVAENTVIVNVDARPATQPAPRARTRVRARPSPAPRCRHVKLPPPPDDELDELELSIRQTDRHAYTIDRQVLDHVALAQLELTDIERFGLIARQLGLVDPVELRNIRRGTPLYMLGLRNGDRVLAILTIGEPELERVQLEIERRGRRLALSYEIV